MAEIAGIALAAVPLIASAAEHYSGAWNAFQRFKGYSDEVDDFFAEMNLACTILRTAVQLLLATFVGNEQAEAMMRNEGHRTWKDPDLESFMSDRFSGCSSALMDVLSLLSKRLISIQKLTESFQCLVDDDDAVSLRKNARRVGRKLTIACSQNRIENLISSLRDRTEGFRILVQQTETLAERRSPEAPNALINAKVARFATVKSAANNLYGAFAKACTKHTEHQGYIGLQPTHEDPDRVNFILALKGIAVSTAHGTVSHSRAQDVLWLTAASTITGSIRSQKSIGILETLNNVTKRAREITTPPPEETAETTAVKKRRKAVAFQLEISSQEPQSPCSPVKAPRTQDTLPNLCTNNNFCNLVQKVFRQPQLPKDRCVGYLEIAGNSKHLVYIDTRMDTVTKNTQSTEMISVADLLSKTSISDEERSSLLPHRRLQIGRQLAMAVLQFQETCWMKNTWSSTDIVVPRPEKEQLPLKNGDKGNTHPSFATVSIRGQSPDTPTLKKQIQPFVRNRTLFNLGKILLELAYQESFHRLTRDQDLEFDPGADHDYFTARKLGCNVSTELGMRYSEIVRKCIECDIGQGNDLTYEKLQASFYQHVICELEACEQQALGQFG